MFWLTAFGTLDLPQYDVSFNAGPTPAPLAVSQITGGGVFDAHGTGRSPQKYPAMLSYQCRMVADTPDNVRYNLMLLKSAIGTQQKLWRTLIPGGTKHWCWARLTDVDDTMKAKMPKWNVPVTLTFARLGRWNGTYHNGSIVFGQQGLYFNDGLNFGGDDIYDLDAAESEEQIITITNGGKIQVRDAILNVVAGSAAITSLKVGLSGVSEIQFTGSLASGKTLRIDCGLKRILNDGADAYLSLTRTGNHKIADWMILEPGANSVSVTRGGGGTGSTIEFQFYDAWA